MEEGKRKRAAPGSGCAYGCLGGLAAWMAVSLMLLAYPARKRGGWHGFPDSLDALHPGMTLEEVQELLSAHCTIGEEEADGFGRGARVVAPDAEPVRMLRVEAGVAPGDASEAEEVAAAAAKARGFGADLYFDGEGKLVGVRENAGEDGGEGEEGEGETRGNWKAFWGARKENCE